MRRCIKTDVMFQMMEIMTGEAGRAMEAAKQLVSNLAEVEPECLNRIVKDSGYKLWSKVAACYVLGFIPVTEGSEHQAVLGRVLADRSVPIRVRSHAAEALGNIGDEVSSSVLRERLFDPTESRTVKKWCIYALGELGTPKALETLSSFAKTHTEGVLAHELGMVAR